MSRLQRALLLVLLAIAPVGCALFHPPRPKPPPALEAPKETPRPEHAQLITASRRIRGVAVAVDYLGSAVYRVQVENALPGAISLAWNESSYLTTTGNAIRLFRLEDRNAPPTFPPERQEPSTILPQSRFAADFTGKPWLDCVRRNCSPQPKVNAQTAQMILVFRIKGRRVRWVGQVTFVAPAQP